MYSSLTKQQYLSVRTHSQLGIPSNTVGSFQSFIFSPLVSFAHFNSSLQAPCSPMSQSNEGRKGWQYVILADSVLAHWKFCLRPCQLQSWQIGRSTSTGWPFLCEVLPKIISADLFYFFTPALILPFTRILTKPPSLKVLEEAFNESECSERWPTSDF